MSILEYVKNALADISNAEEMADGVRVTTHCMYPSNGFVHVGVRGTAHSFFVSDDGGALDEAESAGIDSSSFERKLKPIVTRQGLDMRRGVIFSPEVSLLSLPIAIAMVANVAQESAHYIYDHYRIKRNRNFKKMVHDFLNQTFLEAPPKESEIVGASNKPHKFENIILLPGGKRLTVDAVSHEPSSVNARVVANMDVKNANHKDLIQRIVYDDEESWITADLNLLQLGATVIPFSRSAEAFTKFQLAA